MKKLLNYFQYILFLFLATIFLFIAVNIGYLVFVRISRVIKAGQLENRTAVRKEATEDIEEGITQSHYASVPRKKYHFEPFVHYRANRMNHTDITIDSMGIRHTWVDPRLKTTCNDSIKKIFVFGGSTTWGVGAVDDETIPSWIARALCDKGMHNIRVTNYGEDDWTSMQSLIQLILEIQRGNIPDYAIFYEGYNEVRAAVRGFPGKPGFFESLEQSFDRTLRYYDQGWISGTSEHLGRALSSFIFASPISRRISMDKEGDYKIMMNSERVSNDEVAVLCIEQYLFRLDLAKYLAETYNFEIYVFWQPQNPSKKSLTAIERMGIEYSANKFGSEFVGDMAETYLRTKEIIDTLSVSPIKIYDVSDIFDNIESTIYFDQCHIFSRGNKMVANRIIDILMEDGAIKNNN